MSLFDIIEKITRGETLTPEENSFLKKLDKMSSGGRFRFDSGRSTEDILSSVGISGGGVSELERQLDEAEKKYKNTGEKKDLEQVKKYLEALEEIESKDEEIDDIEERIQRRRDKNSWFGEGGKYDKLSKGIKGIKDSIVGIYDVLKEFNDPWAKADEAASKYSKTVGMVKKGMDSLRSRTIDNVVHNHIGIDYDMSTDELLEAQENYVKGIGRNVRVDNESQTTLAASHAIMQGKENDLAVALENFGLDYESTGKHIASMFKESAKAGVSFEKTSSSVLSNIKLAQGYTFKNGVAGLESMAKKAAAMKFDIAEMAGMLDKAGTVEGSIDMASKLQVLGGSFAALSDPLGMLHESLLDAEGFQDRQLKMLAGLGNFNKKTGEVEISAFNKQRIKAYAEATGMSYENALNTTQAQTKRAEIERQMAASPNTANLSEEMKELIKNSGSFKNGKAGVSINGEFKELKDLSNDDYQQLVEETQDEAADVKDIAKNLRSLVGVRSGIKKQYEADQANVADNIHSGQLEKHAIELIGEQNSILYGILFAVTAGNLVSAIANFGKAFRVVKKLGGIFKGKGTASAANAIRGTGFFGKAGGAISKVGSKVAGAGKSGWNKVASIFTRKAATSSANAVAGTAENAVVRAGGSSITKRGASRAIPRLGAKLFGKAGAKLGTEIIGKSVAVEAATSSITRRGAARTLSRLGLKLFGKDAAKRFALGASKGGVASIVGTIGDIGTDYLANSGKIEKGGAAHTSLKTLSKAAEWGGTGALIGSIIPGVGTGLGAAIGAVAGGAYGLYQAHKAGKEERLKTAEVRAKNQFSHIGAALKGNYTAEQYDDLNKALETGKVSNKLKNTLIENGDLDALDKIKANASQNGKTDIKSKDLEKGMFSVNSAYFDGVPLDEINSDNPKLDSELKYLNDSLSSIKKQAYYGRTSIRGNEVVKGLKVGTRIPDINLKLNKGARENETSFIGKQRVNAYPEPIKTRIPNIYPHFNKKTGETEIGAFDKQRIRAYADSNGLNFGELLSSVQNGKNISNVPTITPKPEKGKEVKITPFDNQRNNYSNNNNGNRNLSVEPIKLDISGTIKLSGVGGQNVDITKELLKDNGPFITELTKLITKEMSRNQFNVLRMDKQGV